MATYDEKASFTKKIIPCPNCGHKLIKGKNNIFCSDYKNGCKFSIPYIICEKKLTENQITMLINSQRTNIIKGFISKKGNSFDAALELDSAGKIKFNFPTPKLSKSKRDNK